MEEKESNKVDTTCSFGNEDSCEKIKDLVNQVVNEKEIKIKQQEIEKDKEYGFNLRASDRIEKKDMKFFSSIKKKLKINNITS